MRRRIAAAVAVLVALTLSPGTSPSAAAGERAELRAAGLRVTWPATTAVRPGDRVRVRVRSARPVRAALLRLSAAGRPVATVASRRLRSGRFAAVVPQASVERRYLLAVDVRGRRFSRTLTATPEPRGPTPQACPPPGRSAAELALDRASAARGERLTMTLRNTGATCLHYDASYAYEAWRDGRWQPAGEPRPFPMWAAALTPGSSATVDAYVWEELEPGRHRIVKSLSGPEGNVTVTAELEIVP